MFPNLVSVTGNFGAQTAAIATRNIHLQGNTAASLQGTVVQADGQTPVSPGARVLLNTNAAGDTLLQVLTQAGGVYSFAQVIPPGNYFLRVEDPASGNIVVQQVSFAPLEMKALPLRLWGTGTLTVLAQDSNGSPLQNGTVTLQDSRSNLAEPQDMPILALPLAPADNGTLAFPQLLEGPVRVLLQDPSGFSGTASATIPVGGGNQTVTVNLQPVGSIKGTLVRSDSTPVPAGRVDAYQNGQWLGVSPTYQENTPGEFLFNPMPTGAISLEAWDPDSRQTGQATVVVQANTTTALTLQTLDTGPVTIQVLAAGTAQPVLRAGINVAYQGGPALDFSTQATADATGSATFTLPPGTYAVQATDPVSLACGSLGFTRGLNDPPRSYLLTLAPVASVLVTALPPNGAPGLSLAGWRVTAGGLDRSVVLDADNTGILQEMPVGAYTLYLADPTGAGRGSAAFQVMADGGALQDAQIQATAIGSVQVTVTDATGDPVTGASCSVPGAPGVVSGITTNAAGQAAFTGVPQGTWPVAASLGLQQAHGSCTVTSQGQVATVTVSFAPTAGLHGIVRDALGNPQPYLSVSCGRGVPATATDANGAYAFPLLPLGSYTVTAATAQGRTGSATAILATAFANPELDITLQPMGALDGTLADPLRPSLPSLAVQVFNGPALVANTSSDQTGAFHFPLLPAAQSLTLRVVWDDGSTVALQQSFAIPGEGQDLVLDLQIPPFVDVSGWTLDASGANTPMFVQLKTAQGIVLGQASTSSDLPTYFFHYLQAGQAFQLEGGDPYSHAPLALTVFTPAGQTAQEIHSLQIAPQPPLLLQLRYPDGSPAPGGSATAVVTGTGGLAAGLTWNLTFTAAGTVTLAAMPPGTIHVVVNGLPWQGPLAQDDTIPAQSAEVELAIPVLGLATLELQLTYPDGSAAPGTGATASLTGLPGGAGAGSSAFNAAGHLTLAGLPLGSGSIQVLGLPWQGSLTQPFTLATQGQDLDQALPIQGVANLSVLVQTTLQPAHGVTQASVALLRQGRSYPFALQANGSFLAQVPVGETLDLQISNYVNGKTLTQTFGAVAFGGPAPQDTFLVPALGQLHGQLLSGTGTPKANWQVQLTDGGQVVQTLQTDGNGAFQFAGVEVGQPVILSAQDPVLGQVSATVTLTADGQSLAQNLQFQLPGSLNVQATHMDGSSDPGIAITITGNGTALSGTTNAAGQASFPNLPPGTGLTVTAQFPTGSVSAVVTLQPGQALTQVLKETPRTALTGAILRQGAGQSWPAGTSLVVSGAGYAVIPLNADGTFPAQNLDLTYGTALQLSVQVGGLSLSLGGAVIAQVGGSTPLEVTAPGFGSLQGAVTLSGRPVAQATVYLDNQSLTSNAQGLTPATWAALGAHQFQVSTSGGMAWANATVTTDGQAQVIPLPLQSAAVSLPASLTLARLGLTVDPWYTSWIPALSVGTEVTALAALTTPPQGTWLVPGSSLSCATSLGDIQITRILTSVGYGVRDQLVFQNTGTVAHTLNLAAQTGDLQTGQNLTSGGAWFEGSTVAWGQGAWVPISMGSSYPDDPYYSNLTNELQWPALPLAPGQTYSIWLGYAPHGQNYVALPSTVNGQTLAVPSTQQAAARALQRMVGRAPEWIQALDPRLSNGDPAPAVTDVLPAWNGSASLSLLDPTGQPVQALGVSSPTLVFTPNEALAPVTTWNLQPGRSGLFSGTLLQVPPDGLNYVLDSPNPVQGSLASGQSLGLQLGQDWAVFQFSTGSSQSGNHRVDVNGGANWDWDETLTAGTGLRWSTQSQAIAWTAWEQDNNNIQATGGQPLDAGAFNPVLIQFPAYGSVQVLGPAALGWNGYYLSATYGNGTSVNVYFSSGGFLFPALPVGSVQIQGIWPLGTVQVQAGVTTPLTVPTGAIQATCLGANGSPLTGYLQLTLASGGTSNSYQPYGSPALLQGLPVGTYTVSLADPASGILVSTTATVSAGATTPVTLRLSLDGGLYVTVLDSAGAPLPNIGVLAQPGNGNRQYGWTNSSGFVSFANLGTGTASITYDNVPNAVSADEPGSLPTLVALVPGSTVPVTIQVPALGSVSIYAMPADGSVGLNTGYLTIANAFCPGRRTATNIYWNYCAGFSGVPLNQPLVVRFGGPGTPFAPVDAPAFTPTVDGQTVTVTFPMARLLVTVAYSDQIPVTNTQVALSVPGAAAPMTATTDGTGTATFFNVPFGATVSANATSRAGAVAAVSNVLFTTAGQTLSLVFPAPAGQLNFHVTRANPLATLPASQLTWSISPGSDAPLPTGGPDVTFTDLVPGSSQTVGACIALYDRLSGSYPTSPGNGYPWGATATVTVGASPSSTTLTLPVRASAALVMQDALGNSLSGPIPFDSLSLVVKQSSNASLVGSSLNVSSFDGVILPEVFTQGTHVLGVTSSLWGALPDLTFTVGAGDDGNQIQVPVALDWLATPFSLGAVASDGATPVPYTRFSLAANGRHLGSQGIASWDLIPSDQDSFAGTIYVPRTTQLQFGAEFGSQWTGPYNQTYSVDSGTVNGAQHPAGTAIAEAITLPLTVVRARLTDVDGSDLGPFGVERADGVDRPLPLVRIQGTIYAVLLGDAPGIESLTFYDLPSGLGQIAPVTVPPLGQAGSALVTLPPNAWPDIGTFADVYGYQQSGPFMMALGADTPGLVKPSLAQWCYDPALQGTLMPMGSWGFGSTGSISYPSGATICSGGFSPATNWNSAGYNPGTPRIPLQGTLWMATCQEDGNGNYTWGSSYASVSYTATQGQTLEPVFQEPVRTWLDLFVQVQDGNGDPYATGLTAQPAHAPYGWYYDYSSPYAFDGTNPVDFNLDQGETVQIQTGPPAWWTEGYACGIWWSGFLDIVVPDTAPAAPLVLPASTDLSVACPPG